MSMKTAGHRTMDDHPHQLAEIFRAMANLLAGQRANPYRVRAYRKAADSILAVTGDLADLAARHQLQDIPGIGRDLAVKIEEFLATGTIRAYEELKIPLPEEVAGWATLPGLSDALVSYLYFRLNIRTLDDLESLVASHLLRTQPGFSGSEDTLLAAIRERIGTVPATPPDAAP
ncbi:MAG: histidinol-phosphatase [Nitrospira sp.]|jgi:DNA polymerase (family X)|nr:histidinol-phosphatase [Nitrospira sp.]